MHQLAYASGLVNGIITMRLAYASGSEMLIFFLAALPALARLDG